MVRTQEWRTFSPRVGDCAGACGTMHIVGKIFLGQRSLSIQCTVLVDTLLTLRGALAIGGC